MSDRELIGGKYYLIDEEKCLYKNCLLYTSDAADE